MVSFQGLVCRDGRGSRCNTACTVQKLGFCQARATKYMGKLPYAHWDLCILQPVISLIQAGNQTLEVHLDKSASTRDTILEGVAGTNAEPMEYRGPKVNGKVEERHFIRTYFSKYQSPPEGSTLR